MYNEKVKLGQMEDKVGILEMCMVNVRIKRGEKVGNLSIYKEGELVTAAAAVSRLITQLSEGRFG